LVWFGLDGIGEELEEESNFGSVESWNEDGPGRRDWNRSMEEAKDGRPDQDHSKRKPSLLLNSKWLQDPTNSVVPSRLLR
jgi:hypothetical protein